MNRPHSGRTVTALLVVLIGVLLLASTTDLFATSSLWSWAPLAFVLLGLWAILRSRGRNLTGPVMVIAVAGTLQLRNLGVVRDAWIETWWPLFVILLGLLLLVGRSRRRDAMAVTGGDVSAIAIFGGSTQRVAAEDFQGGEAVSIFGGSEIDLSEAEISSPPAVIETLTLFGGPEIRVPSGWNVHLDVLTLFGSAEDTRPRGEVSAEPDLVVTGLTLFGGVEIRE